MKLIRPEPQIHDRVTSPQARDSILRFRAALRQVERDVPGLINVFVSEVVDSVEVSRQNSGCCTHRRRTVFRVVAFTADSRIFQSCQPEPEEDD